MRGYFKILAAIPGFFLSSLFLMLLWRAIGPHFKLATIDYPMAMLMTITTWIVGGSASSRFRPSSPWSMEILSPRLKKHF